MSEKITIGRADDNNIIVPESYDTVSNHHGEISRQGDVLVFRDYSSNGTIINGQNVHNTSVSIYPGDMIVVAGIYELGWNVINQYFPNSNRPTVIRNIRQDVPTSGRKTVQIDREPNVNTGRKTEQFNIDNPPHNTNGLSRQQSKRPTPPMQNYGQENTYSQAEIDRTIEKWNWGAFFCTWLWGVFHKMYGPLLILLIFPIPYIGQVSSICLCMYMGMRGSKIAWQSGKYSDFDTFKKAQRYWAFGGVLWFILCLIVSAYCTVCILDWVIDF